tara:strand:- start:166 stop:648 length:483 start_codon:yes stop_codon:yes gene_type:complete
MNVHPEITQLAFLVGKWEGEGHGMYPTVERFSYREEISYVAPPGKPFIAYSQYTWSNNDHSESDTSLHIETGYLRPDGAHRIELVLAQPTGIVELHHGLINGSSVSLRTTTIGTTATAKQIKSVERQIEVKGNQMYSKLLMGTADQPHQLHLEALLEKIV